MSNKSLVTVDPETGEVVSSPSSTSLSVTPASIQQTRQSIALLQNMVKETLRDGRDYGNIPGVRGKALFDPGAAIIISSFNCRRGESRIIHQVVTSSEVTFVIEVPLVSLATGQVVSTGVGAASTGETKYGILWVEDPAEWGYDSEAAKSLKSRERNGRVQYRIARPEQVELINTVIKMASKRAEADAAQGLPGVASALRELFDTSGGSPAAGAKGPRQSGGGKQQGGPDWNSFWGKVRERGLKQEEAHEILGVKSMKEWLDQGKNLDDAIQAIDAKHHQEPQDAQQGAAGSGSDLPRDPASIKTLSDALAACAMDFDMQPSAVAKELGYGNTRDITEKPADVYRKVAASKNQDMPF